MEENGILNELNDVLRNRYAWTKQHTATEEAAGSAIEILADDRVGLVADITARLAGLKCNLSYLQCWIDHTGSTRILIQTEAPTDESRVVSELSGLPSIRDVRLQPTHSSTYGKRVIIIGGGAQVSQVANGAVTEADRHNIRGEKISVDTMAAVGEDNLAGAVLGVGRLHRASILVLAGALMGGKITEAVRELRLVYGIPVISLKMAGSVVRAADLVVTDPVMAGVMAVMLISHVGKFNLLQVHGQEF